MKAYCPCGDNSYCYRGSSMMSPFPGNSCYSAILSGIEHTECLEWHEYCTHSSVEIMMNSSWNKASSNSNYYDGLDLEAKKRYNVKIALFSSLGGPYTVHRKSLTSLEWQNWPSVEYSYLITMPSLYTMWSWRWFITFASRLWAVVMFLSATRTRRDDCLWLHQVPHTLV